MSVRWGGSSWKGGGLGVGDSEPRGPVWAVAGSGPV